MGKAKEGLTFLDSALPLLRQAAEHISQLPTYLPENTLLSVLRDEDHLILTLPLGVT